MDVEPAGRCFTWVSVLTPYLAHDAWRIEWGLAALGHNLRKLH